MRRFPLSRFILCALLACLTIPVSSAASVDAKLLSLVPPGAQGVARIGAPSGRGTRSNFVVMTRESGIDLNDFFALAGAVGNLSIREAIFVAITEVTGDLREHSLLAGGNFDRERIYRSAVDGGARVIRYRGLPVLVIQPFAREGSEFHEVRWLAIPVSDVLLFGSIASVQQELDRHLARSPADPRLVAKLSRLRHDDETWTLLSPPAWSPKLRDALAAIDPKLAERLKDGDALQFGIHYGRQVEFQYEITTSSGAATRSISDSFTQSLAGLAKGSSLLADPEVTGNDNTVRGIIKVSMPRYNAWLEEVSARGKSTVFR